MRILIAVDDDAASYATVSAAAEWFPPDADVIVLHVGRIDGLVGTGPAMGGFMGYPAASPALLADTTQAARETGMEIARRAAAVAHGSARYQEGDPVTTINNVADDVDADLIVVGTGDRSFLSRLFDPSIGLAVAHRSDRSVLVVRSGRTDEARESVPA